MHSLDFAAYWKHSKVTERKHRSVKSAALFVFRSLEHTTLASILNAQCEQALEGHSMFRKTIPGEPFAPRRIRCSMFDVRCSYSRTIVLECGQVSSADLVYIRGGGVVQAECFWELNGCFMMQCRVCKKVRAHVYELDVNTADRFVACAEIVDTVAYRPLHGRFRVILPWKSRFV